MELFGTVFNNLYFLTIVTKNSVLDVSGALDLMLITDIFALHSSILINLKSILALYRNSQSILIAKKMAGCYEMGLC